MTATEITSRHQAMRRRLLHDLAVECAAGTYSVEVVRGAVLDNARHCPDPLTVFCRLVRAVDDLKVYCRSRESEGKWLVDHNIVPTEEARDTYHEVIQQQIDNALDALMAHEVAA